MNDPLEAAILSGAVSALRKRSSVQLKRAASGTGRSESHPGVIVRTSEAAHAAEIARQLAKIADEIETGLASEK